MEKPEATEIKRTFEDWFFMQMCMVGQPMAPNTIKLYD